MTTHGTGGLLPLALEIALALVALAAALTLLRLVRGPSLADRVVAADLLAHLTIGLASLLAVRAGVLHYLDTAIVFAAVAYVATVAFAHHLRRRARELPRQAAVPEEGRR